MRRLSFSLIATLFTLPLLLSGCAGYHIGPVQPQMLQNIHTVAVPTFKNETLIPRMEVLVTNTIIKQIQQDGTYRIVPASEADAILEGKIMEVRRRPARSVRGNVLATREFNMDLRIEYILKERATGKQLQSRSVDGRTSFFVSGDVNQDERQAIPLAAEDAAVLLVSQISEGW
jgi:Lipopolysaccharide-assembly